MSTAATPLRDEGTRSQVIIAGAVSGLVSRFCISPLDVIKIRLQLHYHSLADPHVVPSSSHSSFGLRASPVGVWVVARDILRHEGIAGFWKGNIPAEGLYLGYGAVQFFAYRSTSDALNRLSEASAAAGYPAIPSAARSFFSGAVAGSAATTATYPLDLLRTRFAAQGRERVYAGLVASIRDIRQHEGFAGFFRGLSAGIGQIVPYMGLFFASYESLKPVLSPSGPVGSLLPFGAGDALAGVVASVFSKTAVFPLDTVRKRLQVQGPTRSRYHNGARIPVYDRGVLGTLRMIVRREGVRGLYRGLPVGLVKSAPASAVTMWIYERVLHFLVGEAQP